MYSASAAFLTAIKSNIRLLKWSGTIGLASPVTFANKDIVSGEIIRTISGESLEIGTVYSSQLSLELVLPSVSRYELYGCDISINCEIEGAADVIPMGTFTITEAIQTSHNITITALTTWSSLMTLHSLPHPT